MRKTNHQSPKTKKKRLPPKTGTAAFHYCESLSLYDKPSHYHSFFHLHFHEIHPACKCGDIVIKVLFAGRQYIVG